MNSNLNSDLACAVNFEFESKGLRCAKAALWYPSGVLSEALNGKACEQKPLQAHTCSDPSVRVVGKVTANLPHTCVEQGKMAGPFQWDGRQNGIQALPRSSVSRFHFFTPTGCFSAWHPVPQDGHCFS